MEENELFYKNQFGFRKQHSTGHAIITLIENVSKALYTSSIQHIHALQQNSGYGYTAHHKHSTLSPHRRCKRTLHSLALVH